MIEWKDVMQNLSEKLGVPQEILAGLPTVELCGNRAVVIEQHYGICGYSEHYVSVKTKLGILKVEGSNLNIHVMNRQRIMIHGQICRIILENL